MDIHFISVSMSYSREVACYTGVQGFALNRALITDSINKKWAVNDR
jgi:hypothetical protein